MQTIPAELLNNVEPKCGPTEDLENLGTRRTTEILVEQMSLISQGESSCPDSFTTSD